MLLFYLIFFVICSPSPAPLHTQAHTHTHVYEGMGRVSVCVLCVRIYNVYISKLVESESEVAQSCPTLCDPMDCSLPGSSIHGILQARILEWVAISFSRGSSQPRDWIRVSRIAGRCFNLWATREAPELVESSLNILWPFEVSNFFFKASD